MSDKITRIPLEEVARISETLVRSERTADANQALLLHYLLTTLRANEQKDELVLRMGSAIEELERKGVNIEEAFRVLKRDHEKLARHVADESARITTLANTLDVVFEKLSSVAAEAERDGKRLAELADAASEP